jgi:hypothetical protein
MIVISRDIVERYFIAHSGDSGIRAARSQYDVWLAIAEQAQWHPIAESFLEWIEDADARR